MQGEDRSAGRGATPGPAGEDEPDHSADQDRGEDKRLIARILGPIFRLRPRDKRPLRKGWQDEATTDEATIARLWRNRPDANIGLACGVTTWVLDLDGLDGLATLAGLVARNGILPGGPATITGNGGRHLFFTADPRVRNSVKRLPGLDTRALGGLVVLPPSIHPNGCAYRWAPGREPWALPLPEAPGWLVDLLDPPRRAYWPPAGQTVSTGYIAAALAGELDAIASVPKGQRNQTLNTAAFRLGRFVAAGAVDANDLGHALVEAAMAAGLPEPEALRTVRSGLLAAIARAQ